MGKTYEPVTNEKRRLIIDLIYEQGMNISQAAKEANVYYPTAKAINQVYLKDGRTDKKAHRAPRVPRIPRNVQMPAKCKGKLAKSRQSRTKPARFCSQRAKKRASEPTRSAKQNIKKNLKCS